MNYYDNQFYPTPSDLAGKMASFIGDHDQTFLEPSAGDGALVAAILDKQYSKDPRNHADIDCIELSDIHRAVIKQNFSKEVSRDLEASIKDLAWNDPIRQAAEQKANALRQSNVRIIYDDFLDFNTHKKYDCIIMNPPFAAADVHILKALQMQEKTGGRVIALCNAETIRNPYTMSRQALVDAIDASCGSVDFIEAAFEDAERKTNVEVALIHVKYAAESKSNIIEGLKKAAEQKDTYVGPAEISAAGDFVDKLIEQYNFETKASIELIKEYKAMKPYLLNELDHEDGKYDYRSPIIELKVDGRDAYSEDLENRAVKAMRRKYWNALFHHPEFTSRMTTSLREEYDSAVQEMIDYDFDRFNIEQVLEKMYVKLNEAYKGSVVSVFEKLSCLHYYSGQPEDTNIHYFNGWKTNKAWKVGEKNIIPCYAYTTWAWDAGKFDARKAYNDLSDIVKVLDYLDNGESVPNGADLSYLNVLNNNPETLRNIHLKYFDVSFFKKGTCHIKWTNKDVLQKLNIAGSQLKGWLPPGYGKAKYDDMSDEARSVIDDFQGKDSYAEVCIRSDYFLSDTGPQLLEA